MRLLDNSVSGETDFTETLRKAAIVLAVIGLGGNVISCRKAATAPDDRASIRPTKDVLAEADGLYGQRADLVKVRQAIVAVRQAQADDPTSYDLA